MKAHISCTGIALISSIASIALVAMVASTSATAQPPSAVHSFVPGTGQSSGQGAEYFPANALGYPDTNARRNAQSVDPREVLSLGMDGEIVLRFDTPIVDGPGADFTVFENAFYGSIGAREVLFAEPAQIGVSRDGNTFVDFAFDSLTLAGCAGTIPTNGNESPIDTRVSGGNSFDLAKVGIDSVRFVRVRDITRMVANNTSHPFWDATLSGFDLDAVIAIPQWVREVSRSIATSDSRVAVRLVPNPATSHVRVSGAGASYRVVDRFGNIVLRDDSEYSSDVRVVDVGELVSGSYIVECTSSDGARRTALLRIVR
ncbi:MAG: hypothetical protein H7X80_12000 [bacterium]|nr:hypothetical protein [Candidatus Kapabacteria bacterium]